MGRTACLVSSAPFFLSFVLLTFVLSLISKPLTTTSRIPRRVGKVLFFKFGHHQATWPNDAGTTLHRLILCRIWFHTSNMYKLCPTKIEKQLQDSLFNYLKDLATPLTGQETSFARGQVCVRIHRMIHRFSLIVFTDFH